MMEDFGKIVRRDDGSFVITRFGNPYHVPNEGEFAELYAKVAEYAQAHPEMVEKEGA